MEELNTKNQSIKDEIAESKELINNVKSVKDTSIKEFYQNFINFEKISTEFPEIEDVILSQTRDNFSQLSP